MTRKPNAHNERLKAEKKHRREGILRLRPEQYPMTLRHNPADGTDAMLLPCQRCASTDLYDDFELVPADDGVWQPMAFIQCLACGYLLRRPYRCDVVRAWNTAAGAGVRR